MQRTSAPRGPAFDLLVALVASCASCALTSCSSFGEEATSPSAEAGTDAPRPGDTDADADGGAHAEGGADGAAPTCPQGAFCDSFERSELAGEWVVDASSGNGNSISIDDKLGVGGTRSLLAASGGREGSTFLNRPLTGAAAFDVELSVQIDGLPGLGVVFNQVGYAGNAVVALAINSAGIKITEQVLGANAAATYAESPTSAFPTKQWVRLLWHVEPGKSTLRVSGINPPIQIDYTLKNQLGLRTSYRAGIVYTAAQASKPRIWMDDIVVAVR